MGCKAGCARYPVVDGYRQIEDERRNELDTTLCAAIYDDYSDNLVTSVADQCNNTIIVIHNPGPRLVDGFVDHPNVTAIVYAHVPGQDSGEATAALLYGDENFSGKLPYTVAKNESDYGALLNPSQPEGDYVYFPQSDFNEGAFMCFELQYRLTGCHIQSSSSRGPIDKEICHHIVGS
ncbi:hypothetical protein L207DRAFT_443431 [Hyaloscypha variabilis F]|uniref:beta-glucosidase n=1 Tax=Hyaloscypha variabilis (strain UAMH 11265 / GT02V1 / F) TaxID=1149755 RepID=A0A2J6QR98_HYAVF|nr:hypothetical protein L207DRAFT_446618 [Hyaloscypha variabilis F]PMD30499.1 hypothetical protein L207DRAFT_443431 [Hyaloscypha variabilis F]